MQRQLATISLLAERSPLDQIAREGAQRMLQQAIEAEVGQFLLQYDDRRDEQGKRVVIRNGYKPSREILTGAGPLEVQQPRVRDNTAEKSLRLQSRHRSCPLTCDAVSRSMS
jgi:putative transposase